jgi:hypothetical protein
MWRALLYGVSYTESYEAMRKESRTIPTGVVSQEPVWACDREYPDSDEQSHDTC